MSKPREEPSIEALVGVLRANVEEMQSLSRRRIGVRLAIAVLLQRLGEAVVPSFLSRSFFRSKAFAVGMTLPIGVAFGAWGHATLQARGVGAAEPSPSAMIATQKLRPSPPVEVPSPPPTVALQPTPPLAMTAPSQAPAARPHPRVFVKRDTLAPNRELSQLEKARTLLTEGHVDATLELVRKHVRIYPYSALEQERQALYIKALVAADRMIEARVRAAAFVKRYPKSPLRGSVEKAVVDSVMVLRASPQTNSKGARGRH